MLDDLSTGKPKNLAEAQARADVELFRGDIRDRRFVAELLSDTDVVFHLACRGVRHSIGNPLESHQVNADGTLLLLDEARRAGVERFVHVSSSEVYGTARFAPMDENHPTYPETVYGAAKLAGECYARAYHQTYGLSTVVVRPFNNFGPRSHHEGDCGEVIPRFVVWAFNGNAPIIFGDGSQTRDFIYVEETAHWLRAAAECDALVGRTINLGSGTETSVNELAEIIYERSRRARTQADLSAAPARRRATAPGRRCAEPRKSSASAPQVTVRAGIRRLIDHLRSLETSVAALLAETSATNWQLVGESR